MLRATVDGLQRVLLDGGPTRSFQAPGDARIISDDLKPLRRIFHSDVRVGGGVTVLISLL